jgi:hypothetical protein
VTLCAVEGCDSPKARRQWCNRHYLRWRRHGDPLAGGPEKISGSLTERPWYGAVECLIDGCSSVPFSRGWCQKHYVRWTRYGDPLGFRISSFWSMVDLSDLDGCWNWTGPQFADGYGHCSKGTGRRYDQRAYRRMYQMLIGDPPTGLQLDHLCRNRLCCNPWHLEPVTQQENIRRGAHAAPRTHCPQGHEFTPENTRTYRGTKHCIECNRAASRRSHAKKKGASASA